MLRIQNRHVDWDQHQIAIPGATAKDAENRRIPFDPQGRLAPILNEKKELGRPATRSAASPASSRRASRRPGKPCLCSRMGTTAERQLPGVRVDREKLRQIDLHWHDLRHGRLPTACRRCRHPRTIHLMLGHADIKQTQRYVNITDEEYAQVPDRRLGTPPPTPARWTDRPSRGHRRAGGRSVGNPARAGRRVQSRRHESGDRSTSRPSTRSLRRCSGSPEPRRGASLAQGWRDCRPLAGLQPPQIVSRLSVGR